MRKGFTLIEIAIVISVLAILSAFVVRFAKNYGNEAKVSKTVQFINLVKKASENYYDDVGGYPSSAKRLWKNPGVAGWDGPYAQAPYGNNDYNYFPKVPAGSGAYLECSSGNYFRVRLASYPQNLCQKIDKEEDDGNLSSGRVRYSSGNCYFYYAFSDAVCK